jgi:outer membrane protein OmpA-like peptidoglycan-associated protein
VTRIPRAAVFGALLLVAPALTGTWVLGAATRLKQTELEEASGVEAEEHVAQSANEGYCSPELKKVLRRVLQSCGLQSSGEVRGCQPLEAKQVGALAGDDFNMLFSPLAERAGIVQFDLDAAELDEVDAKMLDDLFADQRGASWFFVVARSSPEGSMQHNRELSEQRGKAVLDHLRTRFQDPDLDKEVGLLWLGEEVAQLDSRFCDWKRSGGEDCTPEELNRSAFVSWIDCRL